MYLTMENSPDLEFEFFLAQKLSCTVDELRRRLSGEEWLGWQVYYARKAQREELAMKSASTGRR
jgi:hypothetical protein